MKLNKGQGISLLISFAIFTLFTVILFLLPIEKTLVFWMAYLFGAYALIVMLVSIFVFFSKTSKEDKFLNMPVVIVSWVFFVAQLSYSYEEITAKILPYETALVTNLIAAVIYTILIVIISATTSKISDNDSHVIQKVLFKDSLKNELLRIKSNDSELSKKIKKLIDDITYSDPMSHSQLADIESSILEKTKELSGSVADSEKAIGLCDEISDLIKDRNNQCLTLKRVKDPALNSSKGSGNKFALIGILASLGITLAVLGVVFYVAPEMDYKKACGLMENKEYESAIEMFTNLNGYKDSAERIVQIDNMIKQEEYDAAIKLVDAEKYDEAIAALEALGDFSDSKQKIEEIKTLKKDKAYGIAVQLMDDESYEEAITAFEALNGYKDSNEKIEEIKGIICEQKYVAAGEALAKGDYETALSLYYEVTPYKDSREKLVEISNRQSSDKILYLGTYNGKPVAWRIIEFVGYEKMHLLADTPMRDLPISDDITDTSFEDSDIAKWLNGEFLAEFTETDLNQIIETDGLKVALLSESEVKSLKAKGVDLTSESDWWLKSEARKGFKYATPDANVESAGDIHVRDKGVRPSIWINLE